MPKTAPANAIASDVIGWVLGTPVPATALEPYLAEIDTGALGARLGLADAGAFRTADTPQATAIRLWGAKALLVDRLLAVEAERLGLGPGDLASFDAWLVALESSGEFPLPLTEADTKAFYCGNRHRYRTREARRVCHLLVAEEATAAALRAELTDPTQLRELVPTLSLDQGSRERDGDLGWVERGQLAGSLEEAIFAASPNTIVGPVSSPFGWHLLWVKDVRAPAVRSFAECRSEILTELGGTIRRTALRAWLDRRLAEAVRVPKGVEHPLSPGLPGTIHRH